MRWLKHPSGISRSPAMSEVFDVLGAAGYGAAWRIMERISELWDGQCEPELRLSVREWKRTCGISAKKLQILLDILENHGKVFAENEENKLRIKAPYILELQDESTRKARKNSGITPESFRNHSGLQTDKETEINKDKKTHPPPLNLRFQLLPVLKRHGIAPDSERGRRLIRYTEQKQPGNPGGYLQAILREKPHFDPEVGESPVRSENNTADGLVSAGDALRRMGFGGKDQPS